MLVFVVAWLAWGVLEAILQTFLGTLAAFALFWVTFLLAYLWLRRIAAVRRSTVLASLPAALNQKSTKTISWEDIKGISLTRRRNVRINVGIHVYRANIRESDYEPLKSFLQTKLGSRLSVREGTF